MKNVMIGCCLSFLAASAAAAEEPAAAPAKPEVKIADQHERMHDLADYRGDVVVLLYGDRQGSKSNRDIGERLHLHYHPTAKGMKAADAAKAPVLALPGAAANMRVPNVVCIPVAAIGNVPGKRVVRSMFKLNSEVPVWLDFDDVMKKQFGMKEGEPNLVVFDAEGRLRFKASGKLDDATFEKLLKSIDLLRDETIKRR